MREGFWEICSSIDQGWSPIMFPKGLLFHQEDAQRHDPGLALIAIQTGLPIIPAWLDGNDELKLGLKRPRDRVAVRFGEPIVVSPVMTPAHVVRIVEERFSLLAECQHQESQF
jgi:1-acyl-sn-glycerol-3-phosphate acyltransferase